MNKKSVDKNRRSALIYSIVLSLVAITALILFIYFNNYTRLTVQAERENYTYEIASQLTRNIENLQNSYASQVSEGSNILMQNKPETLEELRQEYTDRENAKHFLITETGQVVDTNGKSYTLSDEFFSKNVSLAADTETVMTYTTLNFENDYLLYGRRFGPLTIDGVSYVALVVGVTSDQFRQNMTISLFGGLGSGYLISADGSVVIKPNSSSMVFAGYNLFSALSAGGVSDDMIQQLKDEMSIGEGTITVTVDKINWLISCKSTEFNGDYIVIAVPLSVTAADTYRSMSLTVVFACIFIITLAGVMGILLLYSFRRRREEDKRAAAISAQSNFLAKMSHDIRTPLGAVIGMLDLAGDPQHDRKEVDDFIAKAHESANYLLELINGMLDLQKISSGKMKTANEHFSMSELLEGVESMYKPVLDGKGLKLYMEGIDGFESTYIGDAVKIKQILMNLLSNAMKFTPKGGKVTVTASQSRLNENQDNITLTVSDTGIGMSEEFQKRIFQPFEQEKSSTVSGYIGTGLGLNIVKSFTELMNGTVSVKSKPDYGSTFIVNIPLERDRNSYMPVHEDEKESIQLFNHQKILLAEDNAINQQIAVMLMQERLNLDVDAVDNGQEAVKALESSQPGYYSAVILDVRMPVMDGLEAARAIRELERTDSKTIPILALSANTYDEDARRSLDAGMNAHLAKPINISELSAVLHKYIK
jgi:signal transduction histidine kinase/ActR/RegA family two-component response regulator